MASRGIRISEKRIAASTFKYQWLQGDFYAEFRSFA